MAAVSEILKPESHSEDRYRAAETHEEAARTMREAAALAGNADDVVTEDMLTQRLTFHKKAL